ncbi:DUF724 domain-containing protein 2 [Cardamine amara subsp. amara]|uniref:DUF724 domain-containing protein 2 n=1 Tax=Cardamine amara subsp. amara TaxID=228776 RepID=A0ABD1C092_CARAN
MKDEKYWVNFNSPGKMKNQFEKQQLRVHLDRTGLKWVRPDYKELIKSDFSSGTMVELRVGFVWVPAVMVKELENEKSWRMRRDLLSMSSALMTPFSASVG